MTNTTLAIVNTLNCDLCGKPCDECECEEHVR